MPFDLLTLFEETETALTRWDEGDESAAEAFAKRIFPLRPVYVSGTGYRLYREDAVTRYAQWILNMNRELGIVPCIEALYQFSGQLWPSDTPALTEEQVYMVFQMADRFGNFEHYDSVPMGRGFEILTHKDFELKKVTIQKTEAFSQELVVNCAAEHRGRWLINQTKLLAAEEGSVEFTAEEPMSRVVVQIWDRETGELLFADDLTIMLGVNLGMNFGSSVYHIRDAWTEKLRQSASNRKREIEEKIEKVHRVTTDRTVSVKSSFHTEIDTALETGGTLLTDYQKTRCLGAFILSQIQEKMERLIVF